MSQPPPASGCRHVSVAVPVPGLDILTYRVPDSFSDPSPGARVLVPLGTRLVTGIVVAMAVPSLPPAASARSDSADRRSPGEDWSDAGTDTRTPAPVKDIAEVLDAASFLPPDVVNLARWVAEYYACGAGEALAAAMPPRAFVESERHVQITEAGHARLLLERGQRRALLEALQADRPLRVGSFAGDRPGTHAALAALERDGLVAITRPLVGRASAFRTVRVATLTAQGHDLASRVDPNATRGDTAPVPRLGAKSRATLALLAASPDGRDAADLAARGIGPATLTRLSALGLLTFSRRQIERDPFPHALPAIEAPHQAVTLTSEQDHALRRLRELTGGGKFATALLHGVTGSGKTELYMRLAAGVIASGRRVLVLVPEIALTPAVAAAFRARFGERVAIQHSGLSDGERYDQWHRIRDGSVDAVVGTRSAVFAPLPSLGLLIVDEEHDGAYKQEESPRYNARDVAVMRARTLGAVVVLGSATPSLETYHNAESGRYVLVTLERRVLDRPMASVQLVDMREEYAAHGPDVVISSTLAAAIGARLESREQSMVLLNRRGFATTMFCRECGSVLECPNCSVTLTIHRAARRARCHYCNYAIGIPGACTSCKGQYLEQIGYGTERIESEIAALFPDARLARVDRDTIRRRGAIASLLQRFASGGIDVLVGTQMIAKGHDFPNVTLVGVISADVGLGMADFRAAERTFQLLTQVAGRAGRGGLAGEAMVQTIHPSHYSIRHARRQDYRAFYREELEFRRSMQYPPAVSLINAVVKASALDAALADARDLVAALRFRGEAFRVLGPAPAPLSKLKGEYRAQFFIKGTHRGTMRKALLAVLASRPDLRRRTIVDVDPLTVI